MPLPTDKECREMLGPWYWPLAGVGVLLGAALVRFAIAALNMVQS